MHDTPQGNHLYLYCTDLNYFPDDYNAFIKSCQDKGLLGQASTNLGSNHYLVGDNFLQYVTFMGCSPYLKVYPEHEHDTDYCSAYIPDSSLTVRFVAGQQVTVPRCPLCKKAIPAGNDMLDTWMKDHTNKAIQCPHCNKTSMLYELDWRKNAGFFNFAIAISNIFPKEAIPGQALLDWLHSLTGCEWAYFYA